MKYALEMSRMCHFLTKTQTFSEKGLRLKMRLRLQVHPAAKILATPMIAEVQQIYSLRYLVSPSPNFTVHRGKKIRNLALIFDIIRL